MKNFLILLLGSKLASEQNDFGRVLQLGGKSFYSFNMTEKKIATVGHDESHFLLKKWTFGQDWGLRNLIKAVARVFKSHLVHLLLKVDLVAKVLNFWENQKITFYSITFKHKLRRLWPLNCEMSEKFLNFQSLVLFDAANVFEKKGFESKIAKLRKSKILALLVQSKKHKKCNFCDAKKALKML